MKIFKLFFCVVLLALASCAKTPADKVASFYEDAAKKIENATSANEFIEISRNFLMELNKLGLDPDIQYYNPTKSDEKKIEKAEAKLQKAVDEASERFNVNLDNLW